MALLKINRNDFSQDLEHFKKLYNMNYEEFIDKYRDDKIEIELSDKIVVSMEADNKKLPMTILNIFISEEERCKYKSSLIYVGHIAFIRLQYNDGSVVFLYKDDECYPQTFKEVCEDDESDLIYCCEDNGFKKEDIICQFEKVIQSTFDYNYKVDMDKVIVLIGL